MLASYKRKANQAIAVWFVCAVALLGTVLASNQNVWENGNVAAQLVILTGTIAWFVALAAYAKAKGHSAWWAITGVFSVLGLVAILLLSDRHSAQPVLEQG